MLQTSPSHSQSLPEPEARVPTDEELADIASKVHRQDWQRLANKLGFLDTDIKRFEQHPGNSEQKVLTQHARLWCHQWHYVVATPASSSPGVEILPLKDNHNATPG